MKKMLSIIMFAVIMFGMSIIALAAEGDTITQDSQNKSGNINVDYDVGVSYTVTIPASVTFTDTDKTVERGLMVSNVLINEGTSLHVKIASLNDFQMKNGEGYIEYSLIINYNAAPEGNNYDILIVNAGEGSGWVILDFVTELNKAHALYAGNYTDTLTFTVSVE